LFPFSEQVIWANTSAHFSQKFPSFVQRSTLVNYGNGSVFSCFNITLLIRQNSNSFWV